MKPTRTPLAMPDRSADVGTDIDAGPSHPVRAKRGEFGQARAIAPWGEGDAEEQVWSVCVRLVTVIIVEWERTVLAGSLTAYMTKVLVRKARFVA